MLSQLLTQIAILAAQLPGTTHNLGDSLNNLISYLVG